VTNLIAFAMDRYRVYYYGSSKREKSGSNKPKIVRTIMTTGFFFIFPIVLSTIENNNDVITAGLEGSFLLLSFVSAWHSMAVYTIYFHELIVRLSCIMIRRVEQNIIFDTNIIMYVQSRGGLRSIKVMNPLN